MVQPREGSHIGGDVDGGCWLHAVNEHNDFGIQ